MSLRMSLEEQSVALPREPRDCTIGCSPVYADGGCGGRRLTIADDAGNSVGRIKERLLNVAAH